MTEMEKTWKNKADTGFFHKYMAGYGLDIGYKGGSLTGRPVLDTATGIDLGYPGYDGIHLPFPDNSQNYVYSSHCLEHISDYQTAIQEWYRVTRPGGFIITVVPHRDLYEKKLELPSRFNPDHKRFYISTTLLMEFELSLPRNKYRFRHLRENDEGHNYTQPDTEHSNWLYEIELVTQVLK